MGAQKNSVSITIVCVRVFAAPTAILTITKASCQHDHQKVAVFRLFSAGSGVSDERSRTRDTAFGSYRRALHHSHPSQWIASRRPRQLRCRGIHSETMLQPQRPCCLASEQRHHVSGQTLHFQHRLVQQECDLHLSTTQGRVSSRTRRTITTASTDLHQLQTRRGVDVSRYAACPQGVSGVLGVTSCAPGPLRCRRGRASPGLQQPSPRSTPHQSQTRQPSGRVAVD